MGNTAVGYYRGQWTGAVRWAGTSHLVHSHFLLSHRGASVDKFWQCCLDCVMTLRNNAVEITLGHYERYT